MIFVKIVFYGLIKFLLYLSFNLRQNLNMNKLLFDEKYKKLFIMCAQLPIAFNETKVNLELKNKNGKKKEHSRQGEISKDRSLTETSDSSKSNRIDYVEEIESNESNDTTKFLSSQQASVSQSIKQINVERIKSKELDNIKKKQRELLKHENKTKRNFCLSKRTSFKFPPKGKTNFTNIIIDKPLLLKNFIIEPKINPSIHSFKSYDELKAPSHKKRFFVKGKNYNNKTCEKIKRLNSSHIRDMVSSSIPLVKVAKNIPTNKDNLTILSTNRNRTSKTTPELSTDNTNLLNNDALTDENITKVYDEMVDLGNSLHSENSYVKKLASFWEGKLQLRLPYKSDKDMWNLNIISNTSEVENKVEDSNHGNSLDYSKMKFNEIMFTVNRLQQLLEKLPIACEENVINSKVNVISTDKTKVNSKCINNFDSLQLYLILEGLYGRHFDTTKPGNIDEISAGIADIIKKVSEAIGTDICHLCEETFKRLNIPIIENYLLKRDKNVKKIKPFNKLIIIVIFITITIFIITNYIMFKLSYIGNKSINKEYL